jgi:hypothetical protein
VKLGEWVDVDKTLIAGRRVSPRIENGGRHHYFQGFGVTDEEAVAIVGSLMPVT